MEAKQKDIKPWIEAIDFENRKRRRFDVRLPVEYYRTGSHVAHIGNISEGGLLIYFPEEMDATQFLRLKLFFSLGNELNTIEVLVEVVWTDNHQSTERKYYPYGVKFVDISPEDDTKLKNLLESLCPPVEYDYFVRVNLDIKHILDSTSSRSRVSKC